MLQWGRLGALLRILLFILALICAVAPVLLIPGNGIQVVLAVFVFVGLLYVWARYVDKRPFSDYGLIPVSNTLWGALAGYAIGVISVAAIFGASLSIGAIRISESPSTATLEAMLLSMFSALVVGVWEEIFFRGFLFTSLRNVFETSANSRIGTTAAVLVSSIAFGLAHSAGENFSMASLVILTVYGAVSCVPFLLTGNLGLSIGFHTAWNFALFKIFGFAMSGVSSQGALIIIDRQGPAYWTGGAYGPEAGLAGVLGLAVGLILFFAATAHLPRLLGRAHPHT